MGMRRRVLAGLVVVVAVVTTLAGVGAGRAPAQAAVTATERRCGHETGQVRLTFDDAADPARVSALLDVLAERQVRAGFFLIGRWAASHPALVARMRADGHWLGNHTASHADLARLSDGAIRDEIEGGVRSVLLRPPYGSLNGRVRAVAADAGYRLCLWDVDTSDWRGRNADEIQRTVWAGLRPGAVVLLHLHGRHTLEALPALIDGIRERGYTLDPLTRFAGGTVDPSNGQALLLQRDGTVVAGERVVDAGTVTGGDAVAVAARGGGLPGRWIATAGGGVHSTGGAPFLGADDGLNAPVVALASTPSGDGYWTVGADGGVFAHGDGGFFGSTGATRMNEPIVAVAATPSGRGYWLLGRDGGVFAFGDAPYLGSAAGTASAAPFVAIAVRPQGDGYWLLRRDGSVVRVGAGPDAGDAVRSASAGASGSGRSFVAIAADADGRGYRLVSDRPGEDYDFR